MGKNEDTDVLRHLRHVSHIRMWVLYVWDHNDICGFHLESNSDGTIKEIL